MRRLATAMAAAVLLLAGCSGAPPDDEPTPTATASPTHAPPTMPELALDDSPAGAEAFVRHYIDVLNYAALTGDTSTLEELSSPECDGCRSYVELFKHTYASGGHMKKGEWTVTHIERIDELGTSFVVDISAAAGTSKASEEESEERHEAYDDQLAFSVQRVRESWVISSLDRAVEQ